MNDTVNENTNEEQGVRQQWYSFMSTLFAAPLSQEDFQLVRGLGEQLSADTPLNQSLQRLSEQAVAREHNEVAREFEKLFIGMGRGEVVPYASWHRTGFLMEKPLADIRSDMMRLGLEVNPDRKEPEDSIAHLMASMALLIGIEIGEQQRFFDQHISSWVDDFINAISATTTATFYRAAAEVLHEWVQVERQFFAHDALTD